MMDENNNNSQIDVDFSSDTHDKSSILEESSHNPDVISSENFLNSPRSRYENDDDCFESTIKNTNSSNALFEDVNDSNVLPMEHISTKFRQSNDQNGNIPFTKEYFRILNTVWINNHHNVHNISVLQNDLDHLAPKLDELLSKKENFDNLIFQLNQKEVDIENIKKKLNSLIIKTDEIASYEEEILFEHAMIESCEDLLFKLQGDLESSTQEFNAISPLLYPNFPLTTPIKPVSNKSEFFDKSNLQLHSEKNFLEEKIAIINERIGRCLAHQTRLDDSSMSSIENRNKAASEYLELRMQHDLGKIPADFLIEKIAKVKNQLTELITQNNSIQKSSRSILDNWFMSSNKKNKAFSSVKRLSKNVAFSDPEDKDFAQLKDVFEILLLLSKASFALTYFDKKCEDRDFKDYSNEFYSDKINNSLKNTENTDKTEAISMINIVCKSVLTAMLSELEDLKSKTGVLIGSEDPSKQFWGNLMMAFAAAIAVVVSAMLLMSMLGCALPVSWVPYIAYLQGSAMISTVLNVVSAQFAVNLSTAAAVTGFATAGFFGCVGKAVHYAGGPSSLKKDIDIAVQDLQSAIYEAPAMQS